MENGDVHHLQFSLSLTFTFCLWGIEFDGEIQVITNLKMTVQ